MTRRLEDLVELADAVRESGDICGAQLIKWAVAQLKRGRCAECPNHYSRGYGAGYRKRGEEEARLKTIEQQSLADSPAPSEAKAVNGMSQP